MKPSNGPNPGEDPPKLPSSSFSIPNIGTANLTAILATSSLYIYLIALHQHQQKSPRARPSSQRAPTRPATPRGPQERTTRAAKPTQRRSQPARRASP
ncbi:hypothetical protein EYC84_001160 [Monilinia fructicola]|uniref:Uncharacterized protein n=1 Tax=Monilinia fructicola TaxID=38448 RepID=A0A5M9JP15_MONFR|nr:hypothetical protein EYC84_001160 [Monilinia fructicola]